MPLGFDLTAGSAPGPARVKSRSCWAAVVLRAPVPEPRAKPMVLPRFMVPDETQVVVPEAVMREAVEAMFVAIGMPADAAAEVVVGQVVAEPAEVVVADVVEDKPDEDVVMVADVIA